MNQALKWIRRRLRFGLKSLLLLTTFLAVLAAIITQPYRHRDHQRRLVAAAEAKGLTIGMRGFWEPDRSLGRTLLSYFDISVTMPNKLYEVYVPEDMTTDEDLADLAQIEHVQRLHLNGKGITDHSLRQIAGMKRLRIINLKNTAVTDAGIMELAGVTSLLALNIDGIDISYGALERLDSCLPLAHVCESRAVADLKAAGFQVPAVPRPFSVVTPSSVEVIHDGDYRAENVIIGMNREIHATSEDMVRLSYLQRMTELDIHSVTFDAGAFESLRPLNSLRSLTIAYANITDDDLRWLSRQSRLESLQIVSCDSITDAGLLHLQGLTELKKLRVSWCAEVSSSAVTQLNHLPPDCEIQIDLADAQRRKSSKR